MIDSVFKQGGRGRAPLLGLTALALATGAGSAQALDLDASISGAITQDISMNLDNPASSNPALEGNHRNRLSMVRTTLHLDIDAETDWAKFVTKSRVVREASTRYMRRLEQAGANAGDEDSLREYYNETELREAYVDFFPTRNTDVRLGKQQVAWGETDFFQGTDLVHGFDFRWRSFLEPANEELRKPLIMANVTQHFPSLEGSLQVLVRPGLDRRTDIGNSYDLEGGRWANTPNKGVDLTTLVPYNYEHDQGEYDDITGGLRWEGFMGGVGYSLAYLHTFSADPVVSPAWNPYRSDDTRGPWGETIHPTVDVFGATANGYARWGDFVWSTEIAYIKDQPYNYGTVENASANNAAAAALGLAGFEGIETKDVVRSMVRMDKDLRGLGRLLNADRPAFFSVQVFDTWITSYDRDDELVELVGFGQRSREHSTLVTSILGLSYRNGRVNPELVLGFDTSYGGGFAVPSVSFEYGDSLRFKLEADLFWGGDDVGSRSLFGYFEDSNQLFARAQYQF